MTRFHDLVHGFRYFREEYFLKEKEFFEQLAHGQSPKTMVVACCDSRTDPAILLGCKPGELFVVRSIAALIAPQSKAGEYDAVVAAIEYGVKHLAVHDIVVMGHSNCGGIQGIFNPEKLASDQYVARWVSLACPVVEDVVRENPEASEKEKLRLSEEAGVLYSMENLLSYPWVAEPVKAGKLSVHALYWDMNAGHLLIWNSQKEDFEVLAH